MRTTTSAMLLIALLAGCDGSGDALENPGGLMGSGLGPSGGTSGLRCDYANGTCTESTGALTTDDRTTLETCCTSGGGSSTSGTCPTTGTVTGSCTLLQCGFDASRVYYTADGWDDATAQSDCSAYGGSWQP